VGHGLIYLRIHARIRGKRKKSERRVEKKKAKLWTPKQKRGSHSTLLMGFLCQSINAIIVIPASLLTTRNDGELL